MAPNFDVRDFDGMSNRDNGRDRSIGRIWERQFCVLAARYGRSFTPHQWNRETAAQWWCHWGMNGQIHPLLLPDCTIWTAPGEHHEIKHKNATDSGCYGLEVYRLNALVGFRTVTRQPVLYTIHDWQDAGARCSSEPMLNKLEHWWTVDVKTLHDDITQHPREAPPFPTWVNGRRESRPGYFWPKTLWRSLADWWRVS